MKFNVLSCGLQFRDTKLNMSPRVFYTLSFHALLTQFSCLSSTKNLCLKIWYNDTSSMKLILLISPLLTYGILFTFISAVLSFLPLEYDGLWLLFEVTTSSGPKKYLVMSDAQMCTQCCGF